MSTHELFKKHFGNQVAVDLKHPNMERFFTELNEECLQEDKHKKCNIQPVSNQRELLLAFAHWWYDNSRQFKCKTWEQDVDDFLSQQ
jgi:hypothetical protein